MYDFIMAVLSVSLITAVVLSTIKKKTTSSRNKKISWAVTGLFFVLATTFTPTDQKKAGEKPKPTFTITKTITPKPKADPLDSWKKYKVNWAEYGDGMQGLIKDTYNKKDCYTLQGFFDLAVQNNDEHASVFGHNNANLMHYIDELLRSANCYK